MLVRPPIYGLDIVVDIDAMSVEPWPPDTDAGNEVDAGRDRRRSGLVDPMYVLDPSTSVVVAAGISTVDGDEYYDGSERRILSVLDQRFAVLEPGIISTWNGSILDLPFLRARAKALRLGLGLRLRPDRRRGPRPPRGETPQPVVRIGDTTDGPLRPMCGAWHRQRHLDLRWVYGEAASAAELQNLDPRRGAHLARSLAERRWTRARRHLDRVPPPTNLTSYAWACLSPESEIGPTVVVPESAKMRHPSSASVRRN